MTCAVQKCQRPVYCRSWCQKHYSRWQRHGNPKGGGPPHPPPADVWLDAGPLVAAIDRHVESRTSEMTTADNRAYYRARRRGEVDPRIADRLLVRYCGLLLEELYGWDCEGVA